MIINIITNIKKVLPFLILMFTANIGYAACLDNVVLVHGNTGSPSDWENTYDLLKANGYQDSEIFRPSWGSTYASNNIMFRKSRYYCSLDGGYISCTTSN